VTENIPGWAPFDPEKLPDFYADAINLEGGIYGWSILFGLASGPGTRAVARVRMSPQLMKVLYLLVQKQLREYEQKISPIQIPQQLADQLGLPTTVV